VSVKRQEGEKNLLEGKKERNHKRSRRGEEHREVRRARII